MKAGIRKIAVLILAINGIHKKIAFNLPFIKDIPRQTC